MYKNSLIVISLLLVAGCSNLPREVDAKIPLVSQVMSKTDNLLSPELSQKLQQPKLDVISYDGFVVRPSPQYLSALGRKCRKLDFFQSGIKQKTRVACQIQATKNWYLINDIASANNKVSLTK